MAGRVVGAHESSAAGRTTSSCAGSVRRPLRPNGGGVAAASTTPPTGLSRSASGLHHNLPAMAAGDCHAAAPPGCASQAVAPGLAALAAGASGVRPAGGGGGGGGGGDAAAQRAAAPREAAPGDASKVRVLFLSEGNVCRSVYAEAVLRRLLAARGLEAFYECESKATQQYNVGEAPDSRAAEVAESEGLELRQGFQARYYEPARDVVDFDLLLVMDKVTSPCCTPFSQSLSSITAIAASWRTVNEHADTPSNTQRDAQQLKCDAAASMQFNASDVLKEVSVYDTISPGANYSSRVRRLGEFARTRTIKDIDDPLYGNMQGPEELDALRDVLADVQCSCAGLVDKLEEIRSILAEGEAFKQGVAKALQGMEAMDWLVPPMLQKR
eukprot:SM000156S02118  [mRNA]  locus=s156:10065:13264:+ [translate_table: standard]